MKKRFLKILKKYNCELVSIKYWHPKQDWHNYDVWFISQSQNKKLYDCYFDIYHDISDEVHQIEFEGKLICQSSKEGMLISFEKFVSLNCA